MKRRPTHPEPGYRLCRGLVGSVIGARLIERINVRLLRVAIVVIGALLTIALFLRSAHVI